MKKINRSKQPYRKTTYLAAIVVILLIAGSFAYYYSRSSKTTPNVNITITKNKAAFSQSAENTENNTRKDNPANAAQTLDNGPTKPSESSNISATITRVDTVGSSLEIGSLINGATSGECTLEISQDNQSTITSTESIVSENNTYNCPVFTIPLSEFPDKGSWDVSIVVDSGNSVETATWQENPVNLSQAN
jgi:hypothetical protein